MPAPFAEHAVSAPALDRSRLAQRLRRVLRGQVSFDAFSRGRYASDASNGRVEPIGVVVPADEADVLATFELAAELGVPILPRGAGTSLSGQAVGPALVIDTTRLDRILAFDPRSRQVIAQPGVVLARLNAALAPHGLWFPVDVDSGAQATLGGMAANNAQGAGAIVHGDMVDNVLGIDALLADGTREFFGPFGARAARPMRSARTGALVSRLFEIAARERDELARVWQRRARRPEVYNLDVFNPLPGRPYTDDGAVNLAHLLVGSEGSLAWFERLHLRLAPLPRHRGLGVLAFDDRDAALGCVGMVTGLAPQSVELIDPAMLAALRDDPDWAPILREDRRQRPAALLLVGFADDAQHPVLEGLRQLRGLDGVRASIALQDPERLRVVREAISRAIGTLAGQRGRPAPIGLLDDCVVPLRHLAECARRIDDLLRRYRGRGVWYGHVGVGALRVRASFDPVDTGTDGGRGVAGGTGDPVRGLRDAVATLLRSFDADFRASHCIGMPPVLTGAQSPRLTAAFAEVKTLFDPDWRMNPGRIVASPPGSGPGAGPVAPPAPVAPLRTALDWSDWNLRADGAGGTGRSDDPGGGFASAAAACVGCGMCRSDESGTMCPSWRVSRQERDLPRGRANTMHLALTGALGAQALQAPAMAQTMATCVGCKACQRECPTGVDINRLKIEFLHHYRQQHPPGPGERLLARFQRWAPLVSRVPWLVNLRDRLPGLPALSERLLGISAARPLPHWPRRRFLDASHAVPVDGPVALLLFADCAGNYLSPDTLRAGLQVLEAAGHSVRVARPARDDPHPDRPLCCGRSLLAAGLVDEARAQARRTVAALAPAIAQGIEVIGLEPACLLTMRDEFLALGLGEPARRLAGRAWLFEEFIDRERAVGRFRVGMGPLRWKTALLQPHCHQRAFDAIAPVQRTLALVPGLAVRTLDAGCCGSNGSFGYTTETQAVSRRMAELALLPAVRAADADTVIVADGFGCRAQIADGARRAAVHVADLLAQSIAAARSGPIGNEGG